MTPLPKVSIGLPVYNGERHVEDAIRSVVSQSFGDFELIISDNASTDSTGDICRGWAVRDRRIRYFRNPSNIGAAPNYHQVFRLARADLFKWSAHDDMLEPGFLESCVAAIDADERAVLAYTAARQVDGDGNRIGEIPRFSHVVSSDPVERFREVVRNERLNLPIFGLIRAPALRATALPGSYHASARVQLAELALRGTFAFIPAVHFIHRNHPAGSLRAYSSVHELRNWYDTGRSAGTYLPRWEYMGGLIGAATRAPLSWRQRFGCYGEAVRWAFEKRRSLALDLAEAGRQLFGSAASAVRRTPV
jgi:glycosyltransferase involved in cell wall biosynthesis